MNYKKVYELVKVVVDKYYLQDSEDDGMDADDYMETIGAYMDITDSGMQELEAEKMEGLAGFFKFLNDSLANKGIRLDEGLIDAYLAAKK